MGFKHTFWKGPWHYCSRCDRKSKLRDDLRWQRGLLLCRHCYDDWPLFGQREPAEARVLSDGKEELAPIEKLRNPVEQENVDDFAL